MIRKVIISPEFGSGFATWADGNQQQLVEDPELVTMVEEGTYKTNSKVFEARAREISPDVFIGSNIMYLEVVEVEGPYRITEYDGSESIQTLEGTDWW